MIDRLRVEEARRDMYIGVEDFLVQVATIYMRVMGNTRRKKRQALIKELSTDVFGIVNFHKADLLIFFILYLLLIFHIFVQLRVGQVIFV